MGMVSVKCPNCGADIELDDSREFGFCNYCGTKVMQDKVVVEHRGNVKIDNSEEKNNLIIAARNAMKAGNNDYALNLYEKLTILDPNNWEAQFFPLILKSDKVTNGEIESYSATITNSFDLIFQLIRDFVDDKQKQLEAIDDVVKISYSTQSSLLSASLAFKNSLNEGNGLIALTSISGAVSSINSGIKNSNADRKRSLTICNSMWICGDTIETTFDMNDPDFNAYAVKAWKYCFDLNQKYIDSRKIELIADISKSKLSKKINKYDSTFAIIEAKETTTSVVSSESSKNKKKNSGCATVIGGLIVVLVIAAYLLWRFDYLFFLFDL